MKLKDEDIKEMARLIDEGWSYIKLACKFNMGKTNMCYSANYIRKTI